MPWIIRRTDTFIESFRRVRDNSKVVAELARKIKRLQADPLHVGGWLSGSLHGKKSTRIAKQYRLIFLPDEREHIVYLILIEHRDHVYE
jgi:mRNA-degrading endonuclease RelE of RelBE toxin-antitoxin system